MSSVKLSVPGAETLPATSVWRTRIVFGPSTATGAVVLQFTPSVLYSTTAPGSVPLTVYVPEFVIPSLALTPVSASSSITGAATVASTVPFAPPSAVLPAPSSTVAVTT